MFAYEQEVRIVLEQDVSDPKHPDRKTIGVEVGWDPELHIENIWIHPEAQYWFSEVLTETVKRLAPKLSSQLWYSSMSHRPPF